MFYTCNPFLHNFLRETTFRLESNYLTIHTVEDIRAVFLLLRFVDMVEIQILSFFPTGNS